MNDEGDAVRTTGMDEIFVHLRKQDAAILALTQRFDTQDEKLSFIVSINENLAGFSEFCSRWGRRFSRAMKFIATIIAPIVATWFTLHELCKDQPWFKRWFG